MRVDVVRADRGALDERGDRVALLPLLDLGLVAVALGVVHRVRAEAVGAQLEEVRAAAGPDRRRPRAGAASRTATTSIPSTGHAGIS